MKSTVSSHLLHFSVVFTRGCSVSTNKCMLSQVFFSNPFIFSEVCAWRMRCEAHKRDVPSAQHFPASAEEPAQATAPLSDPGSGKRVVIAVVILKSLLGHHQWHFVKIRGLVFDVVPKKKKTLREFQDYLEISSGLQWKTSVVMSQSRLGSDM